MLCVRNKLEKIFSRFKKCASTSNRSFIQCFPASLSLPFALAHSCFWHDWDLSHDFTTFSMSSVCAYYVFFLSCCYAYFPSVVMISVLLVFQRINDFFEKKKLPIVINSMLIYFVYTFFLFILFERKKNLARICSLCCQLFSFWSVSGSQKTPI